MSEVRHPVRRTRAIRAHAWIPKGWRLCCVHARTGVTFALLAGIVHAARAQSTDVLSATVGVDMKYDDNLFLLAPDANTDALLGTSKRSSLVSTEQADLVFDKTYSLQHFLIDATALHESFQDFHFLDFSALNYVAQWDWQLGSRLRGDIGASRQEDLGDYSDFQQYNVPNLETTNERHFDFDFAGTTHWHLVGGLQRYMLDNPGEFTSVGTFSENSAQIGVKYLSSAGNQVTAMFRNTVGNFDRDIQVDALLDNHYIQQQEKITADYRLTGNTTMQGWVGYTNRRYSTFAVRNFSGPIGGVTLDWKPTPKSEVEVSFVHDLIDYEDDSNSYYGTNVLRIKPIWRATPKVTVSANVELAYNSFRGAVQDTPALRTDKVFSTELKVEYQPTKSTVVGLYVQWRKRDSNTDIYRYDDNAIGFTAKYTF
jgi:exopolysaccharide biosynthesis operon protein EpsL